MNSALNRATPSIDAAPARQHNERLWLLALVMFAGAYAWAAYRARFFTIVPWADTWVHLALIRRTIEHGWFSGDAFYRGFPTPPYYSLAHVLFAGFTVLTGAPPHAVWLAAPPFVTALTMAAAFGWLCALTGDVRVAAIGAAAVLFVQVPDPALPIFAYPRTLALAPSLFALRCYLHARQRDAPFWFILAAASLGVCVGLHPLMAGYCALGLVFLESTLGSEARPRSAWLLIVPAGATLIGLPWLLNIFSRWSGRERVSEQLFNINRDSWAMTFHSVTFRILRPAAFFDTLPLVAWLLLGLGFFFCVQRCLRGRGSVADRYALLATGVSLLLLFTPLYGLLAAVGGVWMTRTPQVIPAPLLIGFAATGIAGRFRWALRTRAQRVALTATLVLVIGWWGVRRVPQILAADLAAEGLWGAGPLGNWRLEEALGRAGVLPRVVLSDPETAYLLPYYFGCSVVAIPSGHASAYIDPHPRENAVWQVFDPDTAMADVRAVLDHYHVDTLAVAAGAFDQTVADLGQKLLRRLQQQPDFEPEGTWAGLVFVHYRGRGTN